MRGRIFSMVLVAVVSAAVAAAADHPLEGDLLKLRDPRHPLGGRLLFEAVADAAIAPAATPDPSTVGATLEVVGAAPADAATGVLALRAALWSLDGATPESGGYRYADPAAANGIARVAFLNEEGGGRLRIVGSGASLPLAIDGVQGGPVDVRFTVGEEAYCARFASFSRNADGVLVARASPRLEACPPRAARCGDRVAEGAEECDDGNRSAGDGCSAECTLEDARAICAGVAEAPHDRLASTWLATVFSPVTAITAPPLDPHRLFVAEQNGAIHVVRDGVELPEPFLELVPETQLSVDGERGLLGLAFHPDYATNGRFFIQHTAADGDVVIARYEVSADPDVADPASRKVLLRVEHSSASNHNGGQLAFGPDGYLYAGLGDGGVGGDPDENAQDPTSLLGKILRLDVAVDTNPYRRVPSTNPNPDAGPRRGLVWALGLRNPWRFSFDRLTGDLYIGDVGQEAWEEIDFEPASSTGGENYGWDVFEGSSCYEPTPPATECPSPLPPGFVAPALEYAHEEVEVVHPHPRGCSVTGGFVYRGCRLPSLRGEYLYSDLCARFLRTFRGVVDGVAQGQLDRTAELEPSDRALGAVTTFGEDARGELYVGDAGGQVFAVVPAD